MLENGVSVNQEAAGLNELGSIRFLEPDSLHFRRQGALLLLTVMDEASYLNVKVACCFPLSDSETYLSVLNDKSEIGILRNRQGLNPENRRLVDEELARRYRLPVIRRILGAHERFGTVEWRVVTDLGTIKFTTRYLHESVTNPSENRYLLTDVDGNRYDVKDLEALDAASRSYLLRFI